MRILFTLTLFVSSALLFLIQPMVAKLILPTFGGAPQVWNASLVFFQGTLLLGYLYAHLSVQKLGSKIQPWVHLVLMAAALALLPITTATGFFAGVKDAAAGQASPLSALAGAPAFLVIAALAGLTGLPFFIVSAGAPLIQRWFADTKDPAAKDPYFLYAASNAGSMVGLFAYPFVIEPRMTLGEQGQLWMNLYIGLVVGMGLCTFALMRNRAPQSVVEAAPDEPISAKTKLLWVGLAAVPSSLLMGVTTFMTTNIAPVPLLWVVPLSIYLVTFILAFGKLGGRPAEVLGRLLPLVAIPLSLAILLESSSPIEPLAGLHLGVFFIAAWMCHSRLSGMRPHPSKLTEFFLWISVGGVLGGIFNAIIAPTFFNGLWEYPLALVAACLLRPKIDTSAWKPMDYAFPLVVMFVTVLGSFAVEQGWLWQVTQSITLPGGRSIPYGGSRTFLTMGLPLVLCFIAVDRPFRFGASLAMVFAVATIMGAQAGGRIISSDRSFFGVHRVTTIDERFVRLVHGNTLHGMQDRKNPTRPLTYYYPTGPIGTVFETFKGTGRLKNVALVGLGVGSLAAYGEPGQNYTFYEIDPVIEKVARNPEKFTFLSETKANLRVVIGDARLTLSRAEGNYDLIVLDAFSSDAIPIHLMTEEAIEAYISKLAPGGLIAFHISNRYLDLSDVLAVTASKSGLVNLILLDGTTDEERDNGKTASNWMLFAKNKADFATLEKKGWFEHVPADNVRPWTDDYSNVLSAWQTD